MGWDFFLALPLVFALIAFSETQNFRELFRLIYIYGGISIAYYYRNLSSALSLKTVYLILFFIFLSDLLLRFFVSLELQASSVYSVYTIKAGGGLYSDSNYSGLLIVVAIVELIARYKVKLNLPILAMGLLLLLTFSRTAILMLIFYGFALRFKNFAIFTTVLSFFLLILLALYPQILNLDLSLIDGSLNSKFLILQSFGQLIREDLGGLLFGLGRTDELIIYTYGYTGHTLFGQIVQFGLIQVLVFIFILRKYLSHYSTNPDALFLTLFFCGLFSFFPSSYIGLIILLVAAIKSTRTRI